MYFDKILKNVRLFFLCHKIPKFKVWETALIALYLSLILKEKRLAKKFTVLKNICI